jgi:hypothetical protein
MMLQPSHAPRVDQACLVFERRSMAYISGADRRVSGHWRPDLQTLGTGVGMGLSFLSSEAGAFSGRAHRETRRSVSGSSTALYDWFSLDSMAASKHVAEKALSQN